MYVVTYDNGSGMREWACQPQTTKEAALTASGFAETDLDGNAEVRIEELKYYLWNKTCISTKPSLEVVEVDGEKIKDHWVLIEASPSGEGTLDDRRLTRHGVRKFMGLATHKMFAIEVPNLYSTWVCRDGEADICLYCGQPNELQQADGSWVSLRMGFDCYQCGCN